MYWPSRDLDLYTKTAGHLCLRNPVVLRLYVNINECYRRMDSSKTVFRGIQRVYVVDMVYDRSCVHFE